MSQEAAISEIVLDDDISDSIEYKLNVVSVCCNSELRVDVLCVTAPIQPLKLLLDVVTCLLVRLTTCIISYHLDLLWRPPSVAQSHVQCIVKLNSTTNR